MAVRFNSVIDKCSLFGAIPQAVVEKVLRARGLKDRHGTKLGLRLTLELLLLAALRPQLGMLAVLEELITVRHAPRNWAKDYRPRSSQLSEARDRFGWEAMRDVYRAHAEWAEQEAPQQGVFGLELYAIDGTTARAEDSALNSHAFGRPTGRNGPGGFPVVRVLGLVNVQTHIVRAATCAPYAGKGSGETSLLRDTLLDQVPERSLCLLDRGFANYGCMCDFLSAKRDFVARMKRGGTWITPHRVKTLRAGRDWLVEFPVPKGFKRKDKAKAEPLQLRMLKWTAPKRRSKKKTKRKKTRKPTKRARKAALPVPAKPRRPRQLWVLTSLTDSERYPYEELAPLYRRRWEVEFTFRELKCALTNRKVEFRTKTPTRVLQEVYALLIAYNVVRLRMAQAATIAKVEPTRLSFKSSLETLRLAFVRESRPEFLARKLARYVVEERAPRSYPRAVKARSTRFPTKPSANAVTAA